MAEFSYYDYAAEMQMDFTNISPSHEHMNDAQILCVLKYFEHIVFENIYTEQLPSFAREF